VRSATGEVQTPLSRCPIVRGARDNCYGLTLAKRLKAMGQPKSQKDGDPPRSGPGFGVTMHDDVVDAPPVAGATDRLRQLHERPPSRRGAWTRARALDGLRWVIVGGESGHRARPLERAGVEAIRDQCTRTGVAFFFKQRGGRPPRANGRSLDGRTWDEMPGP
jgi:protein gp37